MWRSLRGALPLLLGTLAGTLAGTSGAMTSAVHGTATLEELRWERRLVVAHGGDGTAALAAFERLVAERACELDERDVDVYRVAGGAALPLSSGARPLSPEAGAALAALAPSGAAVDGEGKGFGLVLVGKDGGVKRRAEAPEALDDLLGAIDAMPMRRAEAARRATRRATRRGDACDD